MHIENILTATLLFQRQFKDNAVLELKFEYVDGFHYVPLKDNYSNVILDATLKTKNEFFYWADFQDWEIGDRDSIWICGRKLFWRLRPELIGNISRLHDE